MKTGEVPQPKMLEAAKNIAMEKGAAAGQL